MKSTFNKRKLALLCASAFLAATDSTVTMAQSNVTLYGIVDAGLMYNSNAGGKSLFAQASGSMQSNRWGLKGSEDLGGGLSAIFNLENGFNLSNGAFGQGGSEFGKRAFVGLSSRRFGTVTMGRQYDVTIDYVSQFAASNNFATGYGSHPGDIDNLNSNSAEINSIKYTSQNYRGLRFGGSYAFGNKAGDFSRSAIYTVGANYAHGPFAVGATYVNARDPNYSFYGQNPSSSAAGSNMTSLINSGYASAHTLQIVTAGASMRIANAVLSATYSNVQYSDLGSEAGIATQNRGSAAKFNNVEVSLRYHLTPAMQLGATYNGTFGAGVNDAHYHQAGIGLDYALSKRTDLYAVGLYQHASGIDSTGQRARAQIYAMTASSGPNQTAVLLGMRHKF